MDALFCFRATFLVAAKLFRLKTFAQNPPDPDSCCQMLKRNGVCSKGGEICRIIWRTKARPCEEIVGSSHSANERSQVCANCPRDPYLSPPIKHISPRLISYFPFHWRECYSYFSAVPARFAPTQSQSHIWQNIFLLLICFSRTLLHPINFPL